MCAADPYPPAESQQGISTSSPAWLMHALGWRLEELVGHSLNEPARFRNLNERNNALLSRRIAEQRRSRLFAYVESKAVLFACKLAHLTLGKSMISVRSPACSTQLSPMPVRTPALIASNGSHHAQRAQQIRARWIQRGMLVSHGIQSAWHWCDRLLLSKIASTAAAHWCLTATSHGKSIAGPMASTPCRPRQREMNWADRENLASSPVITLRRNSSGSKNAGGPR
jgi:hypothetical protein